VEPKLERRRPNPNLKRKTMNDFFTMPRGDLFFLAALLAFSFVSFLPWARSMEWCGMAMQGWMMVALMVLSPTIALIRLLFHRRASGTNSEGGRR